MTQNNDLSLSLSGDAFSSFRSDFDQVIKSTLAGMIETEQDVAEINAKVKISLTEGSAPDFTVAGGQQTREVTKPKFEHTIAAVIRRKEKKTGAFSGEYELVWDRESGNYIARPIESGQQTFFDEEPEHVDLGGQDEPSEDGPLGLPGASVEAKVVEDGDVPANHEGCAPADADEFEEPKKDPAYDVSKPFGWLRQFIGQKLRVNEAMGNYTVRTEENKVILSSATSPENPFYCPAEKLGPHTGHSIICVGYGEDEIVNISIECEDCSEVLFNIDAPNLTEAEHPGEDIPEDYKYEEPEE